MENGEREQRESKRSYIRKYSCIFTRKYVNTVPPYICYVLFTHDKWILKKDKYLKIVSRWSAKNRYHRLANISKLLRYFLFVHYFHSANNRQIAAKAATPILIRAAVSELYMKFFTSLYHVIFFIYFSFYFFFIDSRRLYDEIESTKSRNRVIAILQSLSRGIEIFPFAFATLCK